MEFRLSQADSLKAKASHGRGPPGVTMEASSESKTPENTTLRKALSIVQRLQGELLVHQEQKSRLEVSVTDLRRRKHHLEASQKRLQAALLDAERRRRELEDKWDAERQRLMSQVAERDSQLLDAKQTIGTLQSRAKTFEDERSALESRLRSVEVERADAAESQSAWAERLREERRQQAEDFRLLEERLRHREEAKSRAGADLEQENALLRERCRSLEAEVERAGRSAGETPDKSAELQAELDRLRVNMVKLYAKYQKAQKPDERLQQAIKLLQQENLEQKRRLRAYARKYRDLKERCQRGEAKREKELEVTRRSAVEEATAQADKRYTELLATIAPLQQDDVEEERWQDPYEGSVE